MKSGIDIEQLLAKVVNIISKIGSIILILVGIADKVLDLCQKYKDVFK